MSNRKRLSRASLGSPIIRSVDGAWFAGGCEQCVADQQIVADAFGPNLHGLAVAHEYGCPKITNPPSG